MANIITSEIVKEYGLNAGADVVGIASAQDFGSAPDGFKPSDNLEECRSVIVLGASLPREALENITLYTEGRNAILTKMTSMAKEVAKRIKADGYKVKAISGSGGKTVDGKMNGHISLKHAAELAGLGLIGRNYLLTNSEYGNMLWFSAVLTDAELIPDGKAQYEICGNCNKCVQTCPLGALDNPDLFGRKECSTFYVLANRKFEIRCFSCRMACPYRFGKREGI